MKYLKSSTFISSLCLSNSCDNIKYYTHHNHGEVMFWQCCLDLKIIFLKHEQFLKLYFPPKHKHVSNEKMMESSCCQ